MQKIEDLGVITNVLKLGFAAELSNYYKRLYHCALPMRTENQSEEEYKMIVIQFMLDHIDDVLATKRRIFLEVLDKYNDLLSSKQELFEMIEQAEQDCSSSIEVYGKDVKRTLLFGAIIGILFPQFILVTLAFASSKCIIDFQRISHYQNELSQGKTIRELFEEVQDALFEFSYTLRVDYHESIQELEKLKRRALQGENIMPELVTLMTPERVSLPRVEIVQSLDGANIEDLDLQAIADETMKQTPGVTKVLVIKREIKK